MCRLFGFRSIIPSQVHRSLVSAENALVWQSEVHPDGWGVAYYVGGFPHVIKSASTAIHDALFRRVSGIVSSHTVIAHLRKATKGQNSLINTHPFQYGSWIFAHNGDIPRFAELRGELLARVPPVLRRFILGDTDSEVIFYLLLGHMAARLGDEALHQRGVPVAAVSDAIRDTIAEIEQVCGLSCTRPDPAQTERLLLSFVLTNGEVMIAHQGGKGLYCSTHKVCCPERDACPSFAPMCEAPAARGAVNHMIFSSEILHGENVWDEMSPGQIVGVDARMHIHRSLPS
jgi:glutamine amidotransferase